VPFPSRLGKPQEFAALALHIAQNAMLNAEVIRRRGDPSRRRDPDGPALSGFRPGLRPGRPAGGALPPRTPLRYFRTQEEL